MNLSKNNPHADVRAAVTTEALSGEDLDQFQAAFGKDLDIFTSKKGEICLVPATTAAEERLALLLRVMPHFSLRTLRQDDLAEPVTA